VEWAGNKGYREGQGVQESVCDAWGLKRKVVMQKDLRHCERSVAIHTAHGLPRPFGPRNDESKFGLLLAGSALAHQNEAV
jgi:hypothetical protein